jgi:hypothetical protein
VGKKIIEREEGVLVPRMKMRKLTLGRSFREQKARSMFADSQQYHSHQHQLARLKSIRDLWQLTSNGHDLYGEIRGLSVYHQEWQLRVEEGGIPGPQQVGLAAKSIEALWRMAKALLQDSEVAEPRMTVKSAELGRATGRAI